MKRILMIFILCFFMLSFISCGKESKLNYQYNSEYKGYFVQSLADLKLTEITIPNTYKRKKVVGIMDKAFLNNQSLTKVTLGKNIKIIGCYAFSNCINLEEIIVNQDLEIISLAAFNNCNKLKYFDMENTMISLIGNHAFNHCYNLDISAFPKTLRFLNPYCFQLCRGIKTISLNEGLLWIADGAFNHCSSVNNEFLLIPDSVTQIGYYEYKGNNEVLGSHVFYDFGVDCLKAFEVSNNLNYMCIEGILYAKKDYKPNILIAYPNQKQDKGYLMPNTVVDLYELSFGNNQYLETITISDNLNIYPVSKRKSPINYLNDGSNLAVGIYCRGNIHNIFTFDTNPNYQSYKGALYSKDLKKLIYLPLGNYSSETITLADSLEEITYGAMYLNDGLESYYKASKLIINDNLKLIDEMSFKTINQSSWKIEVLNNPYFQVIDEKLAKNN